LDNITKSFEEAETEEELIYLQERTKFLILSRRAEILESEEIASGYLAEILFKEITACREAAAKSEETRNQLEGARARVFVEFNGKSEEDDEIKIGGTKVELLLKKLKSLIYSSNTKKGAYQTLELEEGATKEEIKKARNRLSLK